MSLIRIILVFAVLGALLWAVEMYVPMPLFMKRFLNFIVGLILVLWVLDMFGILTGLGSVHL